jgi:hypothetical protein
MATAIITPDQIRFERPEEGKIIELTKGFITLVDEEDFEWLSRFAWHVLPGKTISTYYARRNGKFVNSKREKSAKMHNDLMNPPIGFVVDHANNNGLDNRKWNLRICTRNENILNCKVREGKRSSIYKGVNTSKKGHWDVRVRGRFVGEYNTELEAALVYDRIARQEFGEFARPNFPLGFDDGREIVRRTDIRRKITADDVLLIRELLANGESPRVIMEKYGISRSTVSYIKNGKSWRDL